ncbi:MAG: helicase-related protein [Candidatus ainarchaeum sp.]|nr:helicase-related protein [Candidatus ainarchaeum sp.]
MDKNQKDAYIIDEANSLIKLYYLVKDDVEDVSKLIKKMNFFFNTIKYWQVEPGLLNFLYEISVFIGLPQYFDMYLRFSETQYSPNITSSMFSSKLYESSLTVNKDASGEFKKLHKYQKEVIDFFEVDKKNRYFLTAPTSFGKTYIVSEIIKKMNYKKIVLIFPTLSLLAENYANLLKDPFYNNYNIHTLSNFSCCDNAKDVWIYTPERFMTMTDKYMNIKFDFVFMDEVYKIDNKFIIDNETAGENERDTSYRIALSITCERSKDFLLAGPYINIPKNIKEASINHFLNDNEIINLDYNKIEIVDKEVISVQEKKAYSIDGIDFLITNIDKHKRLEVILNSINSIEENSIIYIDTRAKTESMAKALAKTRKVLTIEDVKNWEIEVSEKERFVNFINHLRKCFTHNWVVVECLLKRIGIHHGYIPKYIQKEIIHYFNKGILDCIFSTTTITEGVNTSAKNMIVMSDKKGDKPLKKFDAQNIAGRAGRFIYHYKGRVIAVDNSFEDILNDEDSFINHADYDKSRNKSEIDIMIANEKYLTDSDRRTKQELLNEAKQIGIYKDIIEQFKSVSLRDKIILYKSMQQITDEDNIKICNLIKEINYRKLNWEGFEVLLRHIYLILQNDSLKRLIDYKTKKQFSVLTVKVNSYIEGGFNGIFQYEINENGNTDSAVRKSAELSFNLFRYHLVKYLGLFDLIYRYNKAVQENCAIENVSGLSVLLQLLEYGSKTDSGRIVSDYGVPFKVLHYIDTHNSSIRLDKYELDILKRIKVLFDIE